MSQIVIKDLDMASSVTMSAIRGGAPREESGLYLSTVHYKPVFLANPDGSPSGFFNPDLEYTDEENTSETTGTMAANTANMGLILGSN